MNEAVCSSAKKIARERSVELNEFRKVEIVPFGEERNVLSRPASSSSKDEDRQIRQGGGAHKSKSLQNDREFALTQISQFVMNIASYT